jgi:dihydrofolate reductase
VRACNDEDTTHALLASVGRIWIVGGGETLSFCLRRGLVDEVQLFQMPIFLGEGIGLTGRLNLATRLTLERAEPLAHGVVKSVYTVPMPVTLGGGRASGDAPQLSPFAPRGNAGHGF